MVLSQSEDIDGRAPSCHQLLVLMVLNGCEKLPGRSAPSIHHCCCRRPSLWGDKPGFCEKQLSALQPAANTALRPKPRDRRKMMQLNEAVLSTAASKLCQGGFYIYITHHGAVCSSHSGGETPPQEECLLYYKLINRGY